MSYLRISTAGADVPLEDLGYTVVDPTTNFVISDQFSVEDLQNSSSLRDAINNGDLTAEVNLDGSWTAVAPGDFDEKDAATAMENLYEIANTVDNQRLVNNSDASASTQLHHHDARYFTETELSAITGASLVGADASAFVTLSTASTTVQQVLTDIDSKLTSAVTLDSAYTNDSDGILNVNGSGKPLDFRSNNINDVVISRTNGSDIQDLLRADVSADELVLGSAAVGALAAAMVRVKTNLIVEGNIQFTGTLTDTTVDELNVTDANIRLRNNATVGGDAKIYVERGSSGADAALYWNETAGRWQAV